MISVKKTSSWYAFICTCACDRFSTRTGTPSGLPACFRDMQNQVQVPRCLAWACMFGLFLFVFSKEFRYSTATSFTQGVARFRDSEDVPRQPKHRAGIRLPASILYLQIHSMCLLLGHCFFSYTCRGPASMSTTLNSTNAWCVFGPVVDAALRYLAKSS